MRKHIIGLAIEWMRASGPRTRERLDDLVELFLSEYAYTTDLNDLKAEAWATYTKGAR